MNLIGIVNENEFYTNHYLNEIFESDSKEQIGLWQEMENESDSYKTPFKRIKGIGKQYFELLTTLRKKNLGTENKLNTTREFFKDFLNIFNYNFKYETINCGELSVPIISKVDKSDGAPYLWIVESYCEDSCDVLTSTIQPHQLKELDNINDINYDDIITSHIFTLAEPPRWVILVSAYQIVLIERAKWSQKRFLRFDLEDIVARKEDMMLKTFALLLHKDSLAPKDGLSLLDTLDENSHKHSFGVTEDLKYSLRSAIELLGNEAIFYHTKANPDFMNTPNLEEDLTRESLRYMYRLLFLFYIESRPELEFIPNKSEAFIKGYSLDNLRDLELMPLLTNNDKNGYYFHISITKLFDMIYNGRAYKDDFEYRKNSTGKNLFAISPLRSHLFDPSKTPLLNQVKLRNHIWQDIIQSLSLSRAKKGNRGRGRISYANLGINQLGAVYEALLSYKGFIAKETLFEVKKAGSNPTPLENAYFVTQAQLGEYKEEERVFDGNDLRQYKTGSFIYRLAGRDREKSASYYTPEVLTKSLVKYALKELLEIDEDGKIGKRADEILNLTVCEPAMGSAAFLNEAINQLSEFYLYKKQIETNEKIPHDKYIEELQKVKMHIADNNVYGVDLNPTAVELAEISLWLNALSGSFVPWFGFQLENGNSLIGARREVYETHQLTATKKALLWYEDSPKRLAPKSLWLAKKRETTLGQAQGSLFEDSSKLPLVIVEDKKYDIKSAGRKKDTQIYHFLLGDKAMASYTDKVVKSLKKDKIEHINKWRKEFIKPHEDEEVKVLLSLSLAIDKLWQEQTRHIDDMKKKTTDTLYVWGQVNHKKQETNIEYKDSVFMQEKLSADVKSSSPYMRLKIVMDYWCSLWFWPIEKAELLPTRAEYLEDITLLVQKQSNVMMDFDKKLFSDTIDDTIKQEQMNELGFIDVSEQIEKSPRLQVVQEVSSKQKFLHWELEFADVFAKKGGFDLILGNPPWLKVEWNESGIMGEANPIFDIRKISASKLTQLRAETFESYPNLLPEYIGEYESSDATQNFLNAVTNYPLLKGVQTNLYKCFLPTGWKIANHNGISGFLHPEGVYDDPKGGILRTEIYKRLKYHFQFQNTLKLFSEVHQSRKYSINIFNNINKIYNFLNIANLFLPKTIELILNHSGDGVVEGLKDVNNKWNTNGHRNRKIIVNNVSLKLFASLYDKENTNYKEARLPVVHTELFINIMKRISEYKVKFEDIEDKYYTTVLFDEAYAQRDKIIVKQTQFVDNFDKLILQGSYVFVSNPLFRTANKLCLNNSHFDILDLNNITIDYTPRSNFIEIDFLNSNLNGKYKLSCRKMLDPVGERTFIGALYPQEVKHTNAVISFIFDNHKFLMSALSLSSSIVGDFYLKTTGMSNFGNNIFKNLPLIDSNINLITRVISLNCITMYYKAFYNEQYNKEFTTDKWTKKDDLRLNQNFFKNLTPNWQRDVALRSDYERRQALVEIDVLVAQELKLTLEELKTIYRIQFPVLKQNENETFYDMNGRIVFTVSKGLTGVGLPRKAVKTATPYKIVIDGEIIEEKPLGWEDIKDMQSGEIHRTIMDDTMPNGPIERTIIYVAPFTKCNREKDYEVAWTEFEKRGLTS